MKKLIRAGMAYVFAASVILGCSSPEETKYRVGDTGPAGGLIFYAKSSMSGGWQYLEVAPNDQGTAVQWAADSITTGAVGTAKGTGKTNTSTIVGAESVASAAQLCADLVLNAYDDWYLPAFEELDQIFAALSTAGLGNLVPGVAYWTSTETSSTLAAAGSYSGGSSTVGSNHSKTGESNHVRAVRAF
jgi:hypothetical protein